MKGDAPFLSWLMFATIIYAVIVVGMIIFLRSYYYSDYQVMLKTPLEKLKAIETANAIKYCFQKGKPYVTEEFLNNADDDIDDLCGFKEPKTKATLIDIETNRKWRFGSVKDPDHSIWMSIGFHNFEAITNEGEELKKEYVIHARWRTGLGALQANDVFIDIYPTELYPGDLSEVTSLFEKYDKLELERVKEWIKSLEKEDVKEGLRKMDFSAFARTTKVGDIIPDGQKLSTKGAVSTTLSKEALVRMFKGAKEIHLGRLYVDVEL